MAVIAAASARYSTTSIGFNSVPDDQDNGHQSAPVYSAEAAPRAYNDHVI